jgi:hypothetical protein
VSVWIPKLQALPAGRDNGCAGARGQPAKPAFPKGFMDGFIEVFVGVIGAIKR